MSFSDMLQNAQVNAKVQATASPASVMTLSLEDVAPNTMIAAYSGDEYSRDTIKYKWFDDFNDDKYSSVDIDKNVIVDSHQVNITQEQNSQFIPFKIPRYWDGIDLTQMTFWIHYENKDKKCGNVNPINFKYNSESILFGWLVDLNVTYLAGSVSFEIIANGEISNGINTIPYTWRTKPNGKINILESLTCSHDPIVPTEDWTTEVLGRMGTMLELSKQAVEEAKGYAEDAKDAALNVNEVIINDAVERSIAEADLKYSTITDFNTLSNAVNTKAEQIDLDIVNDDLKTLKTYVGTLPEGVTSTNVVAYVKEVLLQYYTIDEVDKLFEDFDISDQLTVIENRVGTLEDAVKNFDGLAALNVSYNETTNTLTFLNGEEKIKDIVLDTTSDIATALTPINEDLAGIHTAIDDLPTTLATDYYNKEATDGLLANKANQTDLNIVKSTADTNKTDIGTLSKTVADLSKEVSDIDKSPVGVYDISYEENKLSLLYGEDEDNLSTKTTVTITGGGGGGSTSSSLKIEYITKTPLAVTVDDKAVINFKFSGTDSSGDAVLEGQATWKVAGTVVATSVVVDGDNEFDITNYLTIGSQKVQLIVTDDAGSLVTKSWTVQKIDVRLESSFNDAFTYSLGNISFAYTPYGAIEKDVHFILDGKEIGTVKTSASGIPMSYTLPSQTHGAHLLEVYMIATVNNNTIESNHILKDILWYDAESNIPVIGCVQQEFTATQYATTNIVYTVYDPSTETPEVVIAVDGNVVSTKTLEKNTDTYPFRSDDIGEHEITITCGETVKTITATITKLDIVIEPVTAGLVFDFNPVGKSNNSADRLWTYSGDNGNYAMTVSDNFDWVNGGYQLNEKGEQYFCIKAGTRATIDYKMFADDAKKTGKECKLVFKTANVQEANAQFMSCIDNTTGSDHIGIEMFVHEAYVYGSAGKLYLPYAENEIIEFEFNINTNTDKVPEICGYEDGVPTRHLVYDDSFNFTQTNPKVITLGSDKCDLHIYRFKTYNTALNAKGVLNNFIADARSADEMINRYNRNQIYNENNELTPEILAEKCPWLRVYKVSAPYFTNKKSDKVPYTTIQQIYKNGDPVLDNWTCYDCSHSGQGTSSDNYGASARNLDFIMNKSQIEDVEPYFILGDGKTRATKVSLTRTSIPVAYLNFKANVASQNHFTNALLAKRYNQFNPYILPYVREDESIIDYIKTTMEFHNAVVFIQESDTATDASGNYINHREFNNTGWHFYSIGNIGDSKKTDRSRLVDPSDRYEFINEICDVDLPLSEWDNTPEALEALENEKFDKSGTYEWRYIWEDGTDEENTNVFNFCKAAWIDMYKFVVQSSDEDFISKFEEYFVKDSMLYYYLFTERYTMADNRCKNLFFHFGKTGKYHSISNPIKELLPIYCELIDGNYVITSDIELDSSKTYYTQYAFDLAFDYDNDRKS